MHRREFLRRLSMTSAAWLAGCGQAQEPGSTAGPPIRPDLDVAVIGGGMSGLYAAYRLLFQSDSAMPPGLAAHLPPNRRQLRIGIFERSFRLGGRLHTIPTDEAPHVPCEIGGMRILNSHELVLGLARQLQLPYVPFGSTGSDNLFFVRGLRFRVQDVLQGGPAVPFDVTSEERGKLPFDLIRLAIENYVPQATQLDSTGWDQFKRNAMLGGIPLTDWGWADFLASQLSREAIAFIREGLGYTSLLSNYNAADMIHIIANDFPPSPAYFAIQGGYQRLPEALGSHIQALGGEIFLGRELRSLVHQNSRFRLQFTGGEVAEAKVVILAMPPRALQLLDPESEPIRRASFRTDLGAVSPNRASRLFLAYRQSWWNSLGLKGGASFTDLPMRMCCYMGTDPSGAGLLLASYTDLAAAEYWSRFLDRPPAGGTATPFTTRNVSPELQTPRLMVEEVQRQLSLLHGMNLPDPYWSSYIDWGQDPFGGWHFWNRGFRSYQIQPRIRRPIPGAPLFFCGEAFSFTQGWVQGALENTEDVLREELGLGAPPWIDPADAPGPADPFTPGFAGTRSYYRTFAFG